MTDARVASQIKLAAVQEQDLPVLLPFIREFYTHFNYSYDETQKCGVIRHLISDASLGRIYLIYLDQKPIGYVLIAFFFSLEFGGPIAFLDELFLEPAGRQKGVGSHVLAEVERLCAGLGMRAVRLESEAHNPRATALYARSGYHDHKRHLMTKVITGKKT